MADDPTPHKRQGLVRAGDARKRLEQIAKQNRQRQAAFVDRQKELGHVRVAVWIPKHRVDELRHIARAMCLEKPKAKKDPFGAPVVPVSGKSPGWSYVQASRDEVWLHTVLKANKAQWQNAKKKHPNTWRIRSDLVKELGLTKRVVAEESLTPKRKTTQNLSKKRAKNK